ncbi:MAG TPA: glutathione S-transferase family protein, partial [Candidatus Nitrosotalea sp.]|nr:glutathione S-transferase family protein [Candidatus Nitrosotalea sp.]
MSTMIKAQFPDEQESDGSFNRQADAFNDWVRADGSSAYPAQAGRYHLYVSLACPWASRTVIVRKLKGLEDAIGMTVVDPVRDERGWRFMHDQRDPLNGWAFLSEAYFASDPGYSRRVTVPVLWDKERKRIVSNNDDHIMRMFESEFDEFAANPQLDLYPRALRHEIDKLNDFLYQTLNNGVYRAGFATAQEKYDEAVKGVFATLGWLE